MTRVTLQNTVIGKEYNKVIDTEFKTFGANININLTQLTLEQFFQHYSDLFYQIPKEGDNESHRFILDKTVAYLGVKLVDDESIQALLDEIDGLKRQILETDKTVADLVSSIKK